MKLCIVVAASKSQLLAAVSTGSASGNQRLSADLYKRPDLSLLGHSAQSARPIRMKLCIVVAVSMSQLFAAVNTGSASGNQRLSADLYKRPDLSLLGHCAKTDHSFLGHWCYTVILVFPAAVKTANNICSGYVGVFKEKRGRGQLFYKNSSSLKSQLAHASDCNSLVF